MRSLLWATLAVAVLGMHHAPALAASACSGHHFTSTSPAVTEHGTAPAEIGSPIADPGCCAHDTAGQVNAGPEPAEHGGHDALHLCLAILAAVVGVALLVVVSKVPIAAALEHTRAAWGGDRRRARPPPVPVLRRLAVLCVLRQ
ncbi:hypothetical protein [Nocardia sp. NPDC057353]|uniref:hypothetical protein n=1 Tax=Nocardia sp. NPDC057353 TaxID=3346104 RepID=UPI00363E5DC6